MASKRSKRLRKVAQRVGRATGVLLPAAATLALGPGAGLLAVPVGAAIRGGTTIGNRREKLRSAGRGAAQGLAAVGAGAGLNLLAGQGLGAPVIQTLGRIVGLGSPAPAPQELSPVAPGLPVAGYPNIPATSEAPIIDAATIERLAAVNAQQQLTSDAGAVAAAQTGLPVAFVPELDPGMGMTSEGKGGGLLMVGAIAVGAALLLSRGKR